MDDAVKKNLLDLQFNKYLQYYNTAIIILFTYFIGLAIAFFTKQINIMEIKQLFFVAFITITTTSLIILSMLNFKNHQKKILQEIKKLSI